MSNEFPNFGDIVKFRGKQWFFLGMCEDAALNMVRREDDNAFECVEFQQAWNEEWDEIEIIKKSKLPQNITDDHVPWEPDDIQKAYQKLKKQNPKWTHEQISKALFPDT